MIGAAIALQLLSGAASSPEPASRCSVPSWCMATVASLSLRGSAEALVFALLVMIGLCLAVDIGLARPEFGAIAAALMPAPRIITDPGMLYAAIGILGAAVMPHNLYLHSAITRTRRYGRTHQGQAEAICFGTIDTVTALSVALLINGGILVLATVFHRVRHADVGEIQDPIASSLRGLVPASPACCSPSRYRGRGVFGHRGTRCADCPALVVIAVAAEADTSVLAGAQPGRP